MRRRHRYVTVIVSGDTGELLAMVPHRSAEALSLRRPGPPLVRRREGRRQRRGPWATPPTCWTASRHRLGGRRPAGHPPASAFDPEVFRARFLLLRRPDRLESPTRPTDCSRARLGAAWEALGELHGLYLATTRPRTRRPTGSISTRRRPARVLQDRQHAARAPHPRHTAGRPRGHQQPPPPTAHRPRLPTHTTSPPAHSS